MPDIDKMGEKFESIAELKEYSNAQYRTIVAQAKKINELESKIQELEKLLVNGGSPILDPNQPSSSVFSQIQGLSDEEAIAIMELAKLKQVSLERDLDTNECKRFEIYTKTLLNLRSAKKPRDFLEGIGDLDEATLLSALSDET